MIRSGDVRYAIRSLWRARSYAATVIGVVALSVALMTTAFAVVDGVLFKPLPYPDSQDLFAVNGTFDDEQGVPERLVRMTSPRETNAWQASRPDLRITLLGYSSITLEDGNFTHAVTVDRAFFDVFGIRLLMGGFTDADFQAEPAQRPIVISYGLWQQHFGADPNVLGRTFAPPGPSATPYRIVGVLNPDGFIPPLPGRPDSWVRRDSRVDALVPYNLPPDFGERIGISFVRVAAGTAGAAQARLQAAVEDYRATARPVGPPPQPGRRAINAPYDGASLVPIATLLTARQGPIMAIVFATALGLTLLVLLNTGALAAARSQHRLRELAVRRSLGARTGDLLRASLTEQALLTGAGAALGFALAPSLVALVSRELPAGLELIKEARVDWRAGAFVTIVSAAIAAGVAMLNVRFAVNHATLRDVLAKGTGGPPSGTLVGRVLVAGQIAVAFALVLGGGLFLRSLGLVWSEDPGFRTTDTAIVSATFGDFVGPERHEGLVATVRSVPGVAAAGAFSSPMLENSNPQPSTFSGPDGAPALEPRPGVRSIGAGFFEAAGIRPLAGRLPTDVELDTGAPILVVTEALARQYWPDGSAVGRTLRSRSVENTVVGVVRDSRMVALDVEPVGTIFAPLPLSRRLAGAPLLVAFDGEPGPIISQIRASIADAEPQVRIRSVQLLDELLAESIQPRTTSAIAATAFASAALVVIGVGLFGLAAQTTGWRTREMGVRLALGDTPRGIVRLVCASQASTVFWGLTAGILLAVGIARLVSAYLYQVTAYDTTAWALTAIVVAGAAAAGALVPAVRASRVNPVEALRAE